MTIATLLLLALGLSADAFAVAVGHGAAAKRLARTEALRVALFFGAFQALMPAIGWFVGHRFKDMIVEWDHWLAFVLLAAIGGKMIWDDFHPEEDESFTEERIGTGHLLTLAVATSIDALAVSVGLLFLPSITAIALTIGTVTLTLSLTGVLLGHRFRSLASRRSKMAGGVILILIGIKILTDHLGLWGGTGY